MRRSGDAAIRAATPCDAAIHAATRDRAGAALKTDAHEPQRVTHDGS